MGLAKRELHKRQLVDPKQAYSDYREAATSLCILWLCCFGRGWTISSKTLKFKSQDWKP